MKKYLLLLLVCVIFATQNVSAQNIKVSYLTVVNEGPCDLDVKAFRIEESLADSSSNYFCWDVCLANWMDTAGIVPINSGDSSLKFIGDYDSKGYPGTSIISYCFFDVDNPGDSACFTITYTDKSPPDSTYGRVTVGDMCLVGIDDVYPDNTNALRNAYPNPAVNYVAIQYTLKKGVADAHLELRNMLGSIIKTIEVKGSVGKVILAVDDLNKGVYFYSLIADGKNFGSQKLIVK